MSRLRSSAAALAVLVPLSLMAAPKEAVARPAKPKADAAPRIDLALLLDTSNSMDGLINQARAQLWKIVNDLATAEKDGKTPNLRVALYEYGNSRLPADGGFVRQVLPLTEDLDKVSEQLFALSTQGGSEHCGQVIEAATIGLQWSKSDEDLKLIVIAGNEAFTQGPIDYKKACSEAIAKGIIINTIYCGDREEGLRTGWADGAKLADGTFAHIDQNQQVAEIPTRFDGELARLSGEVNKTYLFFGRAEERRSFGTNQKAQDSNAASLGLSVAADRAATKAGAAYGNSNDLVGRFAADKEVLGEIAQEELPEELQGKSEKERVEYLSAKAAEREKIQKQINELTEKRNAYIAEERKKLAASGAKEKTLDEALVEALRTHAEKKNFSFEK